MWKKPSKYKNTVPEPPKREECIYDLPIGSLSSNNNGIKASSNLLAFHIDGEGGKLGILPLEAKGRKLRQDITIVCAHPDRIADFDFSPFAENLLATCCVREEPVKLFKLDINHNTPSNCSNADVSIPLPDSAAEFLCFHPTANNLLTVAAGHSVFVCDINKQTVALSVKDFEDKVSCASWNGDGKTVAVISRSQIVSLVDPRSSEQIVGTLSSHVGFGRENRVLFLGDEGKFITSGFTKQRNREISLFDQRSLKDPLTSMQFDASTGILIPLYDADAKLLFLAGKGSTKIHLLEHLAAAPYFVEESSFTAADVQTLGACLVPKSSLHVMQAEVDRLCQLSKNRISPISYKVPRKTFRDFHSDLYPLTAGHLPGLDAAEWLAGENKMPPKFSLDPEKHHLFNQKSSSQGGNAEHVPSVAVEKPKDVHHEIRPHADYHRHADTVTHRNGHSGSTDEHKHDSTQGQHIKHTKPTIEHVDGAVLSAQNKRTSSVATVVRSFSSVGDKPKLEPNDGVQVRPRRPSPRAERPHTIIAGVRQSKFRHVTVDGKHVVYANLRKVNTRIPLESNGFCVSTKWAAVPIAGAGGVIAIFDAHHKNGKLLEGVIPGLENGSNVTDLQWNPFDPSILACACEHGHVNIWRVPDSGVHSIIAEPLHIIQAHNDKICCLRYNPSSADVLATSANDCSLIIWDLTTYTARIRLEGHEQAVLSMSWNSCGNLLSTIAKDAVLRVFDVRSNERKEQNILQSTKAARVLFVCNDRMLLVSSFSKSSDRMLTLYDAESLLQVATKNVDVSSQPLIPYYDNDSSVLFLAGKGDRTVFMYEISEDPPFFLELSHHSAPTAHQAIAFCPKYVCNVRKVEFAVGYRLGLTDLERLSFAVPRRRLECFQNDIFPDALVTWEPNQNAPDFFNGKNAHLKYVSLKPEDMDLLYKDLMPEPRQSRVKQSPKPAEIKMINIDSIDGQKDAPPHLGHKDTPHIVEPKPTLHEHSNVQSLHLNTSNILIDGCEKMVSEKSQYITDEPMFETNHGPTVEDNSTNVVVDEIQPQPPVKPLRNKDKRLALDADDPERRMMEISESMSKRMDLIESKPLEQEKMEGVDDCEWELL